jgi:hypothetical protein
MFPPTKTAMASKAYYALANQPFWIAIFCRNHLACSGTLTKDDQRRNGRRYLEGQRQR